MIPDFLSCWNHFSKQSKNLIPTISIVISHTWRNVSKKSNRSTIFNILSIITGNEIFHLFIFWCLPSKPSFSVATHFFYVMLVFYVVNISIWASLVTFVSRIIFMGELVSSNHVFLLSPNYLSIYFVLFNFLIFFYPSAIDNALKSPVLNPKCLPMVGWWVWDP